MRTICYLFVLVLTIVNPIYSQTADELNSKAEKILTTDPEKAFSYLSKAKEQDPSEGLKEKIDLNIAIVKRVKGEYQESIRLTNKVLNKTKNQTTKASAYNNLGAAYRRIGENEKAINYYLAALSIYEKNKNFEDVATVENNIGLVYQSLEDFDKAKTYHNSALNHFTSIKNQQGISKSYNMLGIVLANQDDLEGALSYFQKSYAIEKKLNNKVGISESVNNIGGIYFYLGQLDSALVYFEKSLQIDRENKDYTNLADGLNNLAEVYMNFGDYKNAKLYLDSSMYYSKKYNYANAYLQSLDTYGYLYEIQHDLASSIKYIRKYHAAKDSVDQISNRENINELEKKYQTEKKERLLQEEVIKNKNKTLILIALVGAIIILMIVLALILQARKVDKQKTIITILQNLENERSRIARDLHDNLGAELTLISSKIDLKMFKTTNEADKEDLLAIREISTNANHVLRETIWSIHKQELTIEELYQKTKEYANRLLEDKEIRYQIEVHDNSESLTPSLALHLFRIIQESINNASKYANCSELTVKIRKGTIEITDNGIGFDIDSVQKGYGLQNMQDRIKEIKGTIEFNSIKGTGTSILVHY